MPLTVRKFKAKVRDSQTGNMIPAGLLSSDALEAIEDAKDSALDEIDDQVDIATDAAAAAQESAQSAASAALNGNLAPQYSGTATYEIGDHVIQNGTLYRCNTTISSPQSTFVAAHWTQVMVGPQVDDIIKINQPADDGTKIRVVTSDEDVDLVTVEDLQGYVPAPQESGEGGQILATDGEDGTYWTSVGTPDYETTQRAVNTWMESHSGQYIIPDGNVTTVKIADEAVVQGKIADGAITQDKLDDDLKLKAIKDYVTPQMFGAVGDGITYDTNAIQSAIDSGLPVKLLKNTYLVGQIDLPENAIIEGVGCESKVNCHTRVVIENNNVTLKNFELFSTSNNNLISIRGTSSEYVSNINIDNLYIHYSTPTGSEMALEMNYAENVTIKNCVVEVGGIGITNTNGYRIINNKFDGKHINANEAIHSSIYSQYGEILNNYFTGLKYEALDTFSSGNRLLVSGNVFDDFEQTIIDIKIVLRDPPYTGGSSDQPEYGYTEFITISNNIFTNFNPRISNADLQIINYAIFDERQTPGSDLSNHHKYVIIDSNQFVNMYPQENRLATGVRYQCIRVMGSGSIISNNVFSKLFNGGADYIICAIMVGTHRDTTSYIPEHNIITNNVISSNMSGIYLGKSKGTIIRGNAFVKDTRYNTVCRYAINITKYIENTLIEGNDFYVASNGTCVYAGTATEKSSKVIISNNILNGDSGFVGANLPEFDFTSIMDNIFNSAGIIIGASNKNGAYNKISGNTFAGSGASYCIFAYNQEGMNVLGNTVKGYTYFARLYNDCKYWNISNNIRKSTTTLKDLSNMTEELQSTITDSGNVANVES